MKSRAEITFETEETVVLREGSRICVEYCARCGRDVLMATPHAAAFLAGIGERHIFRMLESSAIHFTEVGRVLICLDSIKTLTKDVDL